MATGAELTYNTGASALAMANAIFGTGVSVVNASYSGDSRASAIYSNGDALAPGVTPSDSGVILSTGQVRAFTQSSGDPNRSGSKRPEAVGRTTIPTSTQPPGTTPTTQVISTSTSYPRTT